MEKYFYCLAIWCKFLSSEIFLWGHSSSEDKTVPPLGGTVPRQIVRRMASGSGARSVARKCLKSILIKVLIFHLGYKESCPGKISNWAHWLCHSLTNKFWGPSSRCLEHFWALTSRHIKYCVIHRRGLKSNSCLGCPGGNAQIKWALQLTKDACSTGATWQSTPALHSTGQWGYPFPHLPENKCPISSFPKI